MTGTLGSKFFNVSVATQRRLQTLAALAQIFVMVMCTSLSYFVLTYIIFFTRYFWAGLVYVSYMLIDRRVASQGSRPSGWVRRWVWWRYFRDYFPLKLVKTAELDPSRNYLLCAFPHGMLATGASTNFATEANNVSQLFPGIKHHVITLELNVNAPFVREMVMRMGFCSSSRESFTHLLDEAHGTGRSTVLVVGGTAEALVSRPGSPRIFLKTRKGFVKLALKHGASLVPVFTFGENDLYDQVDNPEGSWFRWAQEVARKTIGIPLVLPIGQGFFKDSCGFLSRRIPITTVVGKPMAAEHIPEPTQEQIDDLHNRFTEQLVALFEEHKHNYLENPENTYLTID